MATKHAKGIGDEEATADDIADPGNIAAVGIAQEAEIAPDEIDTWAGRLGVSERRLREAIQRAGPVVRDVRHFFASHPP